jgi:hypothetical protein
VIQATSVSVAEADRIEREMDEALATLLGAGERGVVFIERHLGPPAKQSLPLGRSFCEALDGLVSFGLVEIVTPDRCFGPKGVQISERARLTESGRAKAAALRRDPTDERQE